MMKRRRRQIITSRKQRESSCAWVLLTTITLLSATWNINNLCHVVVVSALLQTGTLYSTTRHNHLSPSHRRGQQQQHQQQHQRQKLGQIIIQDATGCSRQEDTSITSRKTRTIASLSSSSSSTSRDSSTSSATTKRNPDTKNKRKKNYKNQNNKKRIEQQQLNNTTDAVVRDSNSNSSDTAHVRFELKMNELVQKDKTGDNLTRECV